MKLKVLPAFIAATTLSAALTGCINPAGDALDNIVQKYNLSGTIPDVSALVEGFCANGAYYTSGQLAGTNNPAGTQTFSIQLPSGTSCRLVLTTNEIDQANKIITALKLNLNGSVNSLIKISQDVNLGNIQVPTNYSSITDTYGDHVNDDLYEHGISAITGLTLSNSSLMDKDNDHIPDIYENYDGDSLHNKDDNDDDNDGLLDHLDSDDDGDGYNDHDNDGDGISDSVDIDDDNDGTDDDHDSDDDGDGIPDSDDSDDDNDGTYDSYDND